MRFNISVRSIWEAIHISKDSIIMVVRRMLKKHKSFKIYLGASFTFSREDNVIEEQETAEDGKAGLQSTDTNIIYYW